ncbi:MAG: hypothetical protein U0350_04715 [Caldilineaceae bacterium]
MTNVLNTLRKPSLTSPTPTLWDIRRNDVAMLVWCALLIALGIGLRNYALNRSRSLALGNGLPTIAYPAGWSTSKSEKLALQAKNLSSLNGFSAEIEVFTRDLKANETLDLARSDWSLKRSQALLQYRELAADNVKLLGNLPGLLVTYAYIADPSRETGANNLPVVVEAQDLVFVQANKLIVVTTAADTNAWASEAQHFQIVHNSLKVQPVESKSAVEGGKP